MAPTEDSRTPQQDPLAVPAPAFATDEAGHIAERLFGLRGTATALGGERDQNFRIDTVDGLSFVLKISNTADAGAVIDLQTAALRHVERVDPSLPVMRVVPAKSGDAWATVEGRRGGRHAARVFTLMPGRTMPADAFRTEALRGFGRAAARTGRALRGLFHKAGRYEILWDLRNTPRLRDLLEAVADPQRRASAERVLDRFDRNVTPAFDGLRAQLIHNDLTPDNVLVDRSGNVSGIVDFGDLTHTALVCDLAICLASLMWARPDPIEAARAVIGGYVEVVPLEPAEARLLGDLVMARLVAWGLIAAWRAGRHPENAAYITSGEDEAWGLLAALEKIGPEAVSRRLAEATEGHWPYEHIATSALRPRRSRALGASPLSYDDPIHVVRGEGTWLFDAAGRRYLDAYNNVPAVGHGHPRVVEAVRRQSRMLNTNTRYLHEAVVCLAERLIASMPEGLDTVFFVNSGSEANDLAWRLARAATGGAGAIVTQSAYHGITEATAALSPEVWPAGERPAHVETAPPPSGQAGADGVADAVEALRRRGLRPAAAFMDPAFTSDGIRVPAPGYLPGVADLVREAGGILVADEVQAGHGRSGAHLWSFRASGAVPDVVTMGKPMGNGHPVAAVVTRAEIARALTGRTEVFSTFGGNPVSCVAALAVLDVVEDEGLIDHAAAVGAYLRAGIREIAEAGERVADVRGLGLLVGVELAHDGATRASAGAEAAAVVEGLRARGVLVGTTGPAGDVLKIRPPLVFGTEHADMLLEALAAALDQG